MKNRPPSLIKGFLADDLPAAADLYCDIEVTAPGGLQAYVPGLAVTGLAVLAAGFLSDHYGAPMTLMGLLIGLSLNFLNEDRRLHPGLIFGSQSLLRVGIMLVGVRVTITQIADLGPQALLCVAAITVLTLVAGIAAARALGFSRAFGVLAGGAVAICGASAALALASVLGERRISQPQLTIVLVGITAMSSFAMFTYPMISHGLGLSDRQAGFFLGAAIHDVAQALGAGYSVSNVAGETAAIVKLSRVMLLAPILAAIALFMAGNERGAGVVANIPWFVFGFFGLVLVNSTGIIPTGASSFFNQFATILIAWAVTAAGIRSPMSTLLRSGIKPLLVIIGASAAAAALALCAAILLL